MIAGNACEEILLSHGYNHVILQKPYQCSVLFTNDATICNLDQLFSIGIVTTSRSLGEYTATNMILKQGLSIPHVSEHENISMKQLGKRRRRQRQRQRRQQKREEQRRQQQEVQRPGELQIQQRQEPEPLQIRLSSRTSSELDRDPEYWYSQGFEDYMEDYNTPLLEAYNWEKMDPKQRWEQEQLNDFEGFVALKRLALINNEHQQLHEIETIQNYEGQAAQQRN